MFDTKSKLERIRHNLRVELVESDDLDGYEAEEYVEEAIECLDKAIEELDR